MDTSDKNILLIVGVRVPAGDVERVFNALEAYAAAHEDSFIGKIDVKRVSAEAFNLWLPLRCRGTEDSAFWMNDFTAYLTEHDVQWHSE